MKIKEIRQINHYEAKGFMKALTEETNDLQGKGLDVEIQYSNGETYSAILIGREAKKEAKPHNEGKDSKTIR